MQWDSAGNQCEIAKSRNRTLQQNKSYDCLKIPQKHLYTITRGRKTSTACGTLQLTEVFVALHFCSCFNWGFVWGQALINISPWEKSHVLFPFPAPHMQFWLHTWSVTFLCNQSPAAPGYWFHLPRFLSLPHWKSFLTVVLVKYNLHLIMCLIWA